MALFLHHGKFISVVGFHLLILIYFKNIEDNTIISYTTMMFYSIKQSLEVRGRKKLLYGLSTCF